MADVDTTFMPVRVEFGGLVFSGSQTEADSFGCKLAYGSLPGWEDLPATTGTVVANQYSDGGVMTDSRYSPRTLVLNGWLLAPNRIETRKAIARLKRALATAKYTAQPLVVVEDDVTRHALVKLNQDQHINWVKNKGNYVEFSFQFLAEDSRLIWGNGVGYQWNVPLALAPSGSPAKIAVINEGDSASPKCRIELDGFNQPTITHLETGQTMTINLNMPVGTSAIIDFDKRSIRDSFGNSIRGNTVGRLFKLLEDVNTFQITAASYSADAVMTTRYSSTTN